MCKKCVDAVRLYFPDCPDAEVGNFLLCATPFPCGDGDDVERSLKDHHDAGCRTIGEAMARADKQTEDAMAELSREEDPA